VDNLFAAARDCLLEPDPDIKVNRTQKVAAAWLAGQLDLAEQPAPDPAVEAGRPERQVLVPPNRLARRSPAHIPGRAALIHAVTHIEFNAINLAWDAVYRFRGLPWDYYSDWVQVAREEAEHFLALRGRLQALGYAYGDFSAHGGLWSMAQRTGQDPLLRMALVPRLLEARGLDVTPAMRERLLAVGDGETAAVLEVVLREEIGHVAAGTRWFRFLCAERGLEPEREFFRLLDLYYPGGVRGPLNLEARRQAGFTAGELACLESLDRGGVPGSA
jgi:uncharacterized ferritin-like protein (DUF455 family)